MPKQRGRYFKRAAKTGKQFESLSKNQWAIIAYADEKGAIPFSLYPARSINALVGRGMLYQSDSGYKLTDKGQADYNRKKQADYNREKRERQFKQHWERHGLQGVKVFYDLEGQREQTMINLPEAEHRFDVVFPDYRLAVEIQGGTATGGRHVRFGGYETDSVKNNLAVAKGWAVLAITGIMLDNDPLGCIRAVVEALHARLNYALLPVLAEANFAYIGRDKIILSTDEDFIAHIMQASASFAPLRAHIVQNWLASTYNPTTVSFRRDFAGGKSILQGQEKQFLQHWGIDKL